ncbi:anthocyanidin 5,3-O-glucosyltransferase-like [Syzygium oleosum]|uniref:anthocyanidin 5,3-O-glucosyltransferase-like n=1 Tax=Syzygium oleosum TaxID=219896 RepID=UPI0011D1BA6C|nr:anthocyanidin 5,3-O-glucosyltransferase-like [Syzygium oleosum]
MTEKADKCHLVMYPSPGRGHLMSLVELAQSLLRHHSCLSVTVLISSPPHLLPFITPYISSVSSATPSIAFRHLPSVSLPPSLSSGATAFSDNPAMYFEYARLNNPNLHQALSELLSASKPSQKPKALVVDFFYSSGAEVAAALCLPAYYYFPSGANPLAAFLYLPTLHKLTNTSFKDLDGNVDIPGVPPIPAKHMPSRMLDRSSRIYGHFLETSMRLAGSAGLISNTFKALEPRAVKVISEGLCVPDGRTPPVYSIGPLVAANDHISEQDCLTWLDSQPSRSVLFMTFGSMGVFSSKQLRDIAHALERSGVRFLWVVRNPPPDDEIWRNLAIKPEDDPGMDAILPRGFTERTKDRGLVLKSWAPQVAVLSHDSVGGFVSHCGWNSVMEAVCAGVPMIVWPLYAEHKLIRAYLAGEMKLVLSVAETEGGFVTTDELAGRITALMCSEKGREVRERVAEMRNAAREALSEGGSSRVAMAKLVDSFKSGMM